MTGPGAWLANGVPCCVTASRFTLFLVSLRDPFDWAVRFYTRPLFATPEMAELSFDDFIAAPWHAVMSRPKAFRLEPRAHRGQALQADRHPITGQAHGSIFEMRSVKLRAWLGLFERGVPVALIRAETFRDAPEAVLAHLEHHFPLDRKLWDWEPPEDPSPQDEAMETRRAHALARLSECREAIVSRLDQGLERACGYLSDG